MGPPPEWISGFWARSTRARLKPAPISTRRETRLEAIACNRLSLYANSLYFERAKSQYKNHAIDDFTYIKDFRVIGDGFTNDIAAF